MKKANHITDFAILFIVSLVLFLLFQPTFNEITIATYHAKQKAYLNRIYQSKDIDPKRFWEMREFYSRGTFLFHKTGIPVTDLPETLRTAYEPYSDDNNNIILLFTSPKLVSIDVLVDDTLFENKPVELTQKDDETVMIFIKPLDDMKLANGFLDYHDIDKSLTENKKWLSVTAVSK